MSVNLEKKAGAVKSRSDFVDFVDALRRDLVIHSQDWQNVSLEDYLQAISACVQDMENYYKRKHMALPTILDWRIVAEMLLEAKFYE